jgi:hypothetical protein
MTSSASQIRDGQIEEPGAFGWCIRCAFPAVREPET